MRAGELTTAQLTDSYIAAVTEGTPAGVIDLDTLREGVPLDEVLTRPATTLYTELSEGKPLDRALEIASARLTNLVLTNLQLAMTRQAQASTSASQRPMWQRTVGGKKTCGLCLIASTQRYWKKDLLPIHPGCGCGVAPYYGPDQQIIDEGLLDAAHDAVHTYLGESDRGGRSPDYKNVTLTRNRNGSISATDRETGKKTEIVKVRIHGEYGPTLTWADQHFTGPNGL